jgi:hypothetical protein
MRILKRANNNTKRLAYTALVRPILDYGAVLGPIQRRPGKPFESRAKESGKVADNTNELGWGTLAQRRAIARICPFSKHTPGDRLGKQ